MARSFGAKRAQNWRYFDHNMVSRCWCSFSLLSIYSCGACHSGFSAITA